MKCLNWIYFKEQKTTRRIAYRRWYASHASDGLLEAAVRLKQKKVN